jgi:hypothetical protein
MPKRRWSPVDRYEWIAFAVLFPSLLALLAILFVLTGRVVVVALAGPILAGLSASTRNAIPARLRGRPLDPN